MKLEITRQTFVKGELKFPGDIVDVEKADADNLIRKSRPYVEPEKKKPAAPKKAAPKKTAEKYTGD